MADFLRNSMGRLSSRLSRSTAAAPPAAPTIPDDASFVFNIIWTGTVFDHLKYFVASQFDHSGARFRFISNGCSTEQTTAMEQFADRFPDRIVDLFVMPGTDMVGHGVCLDAVLRATNDGPHFGLIDPDIRASGPFLIDFAARLADGCAAASSGRGVWSETDHIPAGHPGVNGEYFYSTDGFLFGSPHFAVYRRSAIDETRARWGVGFGSGGPDLVDASKQKLLAEGHDYLVYDTGKLMNAFLQFDGYRFEHFEHPHLMHIGGLSHYLAPPAYVVDDDGQQQPDWVRYAGMATRFEVARFTARVLTELVAGHVAPEVPTGLDDSTTGRLHVVRAALIDLVTTYDAVVR
jgi:hypothetical protein